MELRTAIFPTPRPMRADHLAPGLMVDGASIIEWVTSRHRFGPVPDERDLELARSTYWVVDEVIPWDRRATTIHTLNAGSWCLPSGHPVVVHGKLHPESLEDMRHQRTENGDDDEHP